MYFVTFFLCFQALLALMDEAYTGSIIADSQSNAGNGGNAKDETEALFADLLKDENEGLAVNSFPSSNESTQYVSSFIKMIRDFVIAAGASLVFSRDGSCTPSFNGIESFATSATCFSIDTLVTSCVFLRSSTRCE